MKRAAEALGHWSRRQLDVCRKEPMTPEQRKLTPFGACSCGITFWALGCRETYTYMGPVKFPSHFLIPSATMERSPSSSSGRNSLSPLSKRVSYLGAKLERVFGGGGGTSDKVSDDESESDNITLADGESSFSRGSFADKQR